MNSPQKLELIRELAETGASVAVIEAKLQLKSGSISTWIAKGEANKRTIYARFRSIFRSWAAESTYTAQQQLLVKNPGKWLETSSTAKVVENVKSTGLVPTSGQQQAINRPNLAAEALAAAMKVLIDSKNIDAKDIIDVEEVSKEDE
jgi:hypothetical protein